VNIDPPGLEGLRITHGLEPVQGYRREFLRETFLDGFRLLGALFRREVLEAIGGPGPARTAAERRALALQILALQPIVRAAVTVAWSPADRSGRRRTKAESLPTRTESFGGDLGALTSPGCPLPEGGLALPTRGEIDGAGGPVGRCDPHGLEDR